MSSGSRASAVLGISALVLGGLAIVVWAVLPPATPPSVAQTLPATAAAPAPIAADPARASKLAAARERWPYESLTDRLPKGVAVPPTRPLGREATARWEGINHDLAAGASMRADVFRALHERTRELFLDSPGAGSGRVFMRTDESILLREEWDRVSPPQPGSPAEFPDSPGEALGTVPADAEFHTLHADRLFDFLFPDGFGYVRDRDHVAGFRSHGFQFGLPFPFKQWRWEVRHVLLVGVLAQPAPVVYMTDRMPSMEQTRKGKTRAPDPFETAGLAALGDGEDLYLARKAETVRMLGAVRVTRVCQQCHEAAIGDLLGALSYTLQPAAKDTAEPAPAPERAGGK